MPAHHAESDSVATKELDQEMESIQETMKNRGIHFNRLWQHQPSAADGGLIKVLQTDRMTLIFTAIIFIINLYLIFPILSLNVTPAFGSSTLLPIIAWLESLIHIDRDVIFTFVTFLALAYAPVSFYFFVRKLAFRNELTAFLATILFILPNPFFQHGLPLIDAVLNGDGAHAVVFSFLPLLFVSAQNYISSGKVRYGIMSSFFAASVAIVSPFASLNFFIILGLITIAEGWNGQFRAKLWRSLFMLSSTIALAAFWLVPTVLGDTSFINQINQALKQIMTVAPIALPAIPILGILSFLILNRQSYMRSVFLCSSLFFVYLSLYSISHDINMGGIFTPNRYLTELSFAASLMLAGIFTMPIENFLQRYIYNQKGSSQFYIVISSAAVIAVILLGLTFVRIHTIQQELLKLPSLSQSQIDQPMTSFSLVFYPKYQLVPSAISLLTLGGLVGFILFRSSQLYLFNNVRHPS